MRKYICCISLEEWFECVLNVCRLHVNWWSWKGIWSARRSALRWLRRKSTHAPWKLTPTQEPPYIIHVVVDHVITTLTACYYTHSLVIYFTIISWLFILTVWLIWKNANNLLKVAIKNVYDWLIDYWPYYFITRTCILAP